MIRRVLRTAALLGLAWLCGGAAAAAAEARLDASNPRIELWPDVRVLRDPGGTLDAEAAARSTGFSDPGGAYASLGMGEDAIWIRVPYTVAAGGGGEWILDLGYALLDRVDVHVVSNGRVVRRAVLGYDQPAASRPLPNRTHAMALDFAEGTSGVILLRIEKSGARILPLTLSRLPAFLGRTLAEQLMQGAFACLGVILLLYSLAQWLHLRDPLYLSYALVVICSVTFSLHLFGIGEMYLWTDLEWPQRKLAGVTSMLAAAASALFVAEVLGADLQRSLRIGLLAVAALLGIATLAYGTGAIGIGAVAVVMSTIGLAPSLMGLPGAFAKIRRGDSVGAWFMLAWVTSFVTGAILVGVTTGRIGAGFWTLHAFQFGTVLDMLVFGRIAVLRTAALHREASRAALERDQMHSLAHTDALTGLANRRGLDDALSIALGAATPERGVALYMLDLDGFKPINDRYGHETGDQLLQAIGQRLSHSVRTADTVARVGGDEFVVVASGISGDAQARELAAKLAGVFREPFTLERHACQVGTSIGYALAPRDGRDAAALLKVADAAMYALKTGRSARWA